MWIQHDSTWFNHSPTQAALASQVVSRLGSREHSPFCRRRCLHFARWLGKQFRPLRDPFPSGNLAFLLVFEVTFLQFQTWDKRRSTSRQHSKKISKPCFLLKHMFKAPRVAGHQQVAGTSWMIKVVHLSNLSGHGALGRSLCTMISWKMKVKATHTRISVQTLIRTKTHCKHPSRWLSDIFHLTGHLMDHEPSILVNPDGFPQRFFSTPNLNRLGTWGYRLGKTLRRSRLHHWRSRISTGLRRTPPTICIQFIKICHVGGVVDRGPQGLGGCLRCQVGENAFWKLNMTLWESTKLSWC